MGELYDELYGEKGEIEMLVNMNDVLIPARKGGYGVEAYDALSGLKSFEELDRKYGL